MTKDRGLTVHFMDGTKASFSFPKQVSHDEFLIARMDKILDKSALVVEADGAVMIIPYTSIKYVQLHGSAAKLPDYVIKDATVDA